MSSNTQERFENVTVICKANVFFDGKVVSHSILTPSGKKTIGLIHPGEFRFTTEASERMEITSGTCRVRLSDEKKWTLYTPGASFTVPPKSSFEITVEKGITEYICSFGV